MLTLASYCSLREFRFPAENARSLVQCANDQKREGDDESEGPEPVVEIPAMLLSLPVGGKMGGRPEPDPVVDWNGTDERERDGQHLDREGRLREMPGEDAQMRKGQEQEQVEEGGGNHPEGHDAAQQCGQ